MNQYYLSTEWFSLFEFIFFFSFSRLFHDTFCLFFSPEGFGGPLEVEYIYSGNVVTGIRYIIVSTMEHDAGLYSCTVTNKFGSATKYLNLYVDISGGSGGSGENEKARSTLLKAGFHWRRSRSRKSASDLVKIENRSRKRS